MGGAAIALATEIEQAAPLDLSQALSMVDRVAWAASERDLDIWLHEVRSSWSASSGPAAGWSAETGDAAAWSSGARPGGERGPSESPDRSVRSLVAGAVDAPARVPFATPPDTFYAVEVDLVQGPPFGTRELGLSVREAIAWTNPTSAPLRGVALRVFANGQDVSPGGARIRGVWVDNRPARFTIEGTVLGVELPRPLGPGERARILVHVDQQIRSFDPRRPVHDETLYLEEIGAFGRAEGAVNLGWFLPLVTPVDERGMFDVRPLRANTEHAMFDPASFHVVLNLPDHYAVATTGVEVTRRSDGGEATVVAVASDARDFAVMLVPNGAVSTTEVDGLELRVFHPADEPRIGAELLVYAEGAVRTYVRQFGPLAQTELDVVEAPLRGLTAVDFPGLVAIDVRHQGVPYHRSASHEWTLAHEIAHQWWGVEVGSDPAMSPWLDEALSSYAAALYWSEKYGPDAVEARYELEVRDRLVALRDGGIEDLPADLPAWKYDLGQFAAIVQGRGSLFFEQVRGVLGDEVFFGALQAYHDRYRGRFVTAGELVAALRGATTDPVARARIEALFERWIREPHSYEDLLPADADR